MWTTIAQDIARATGQPFDLQDRRSVGGGSINQAFRISDGDRDYFLKLNQASQYAMFEAEALGLREMAATETIRVPQPLCWGTAEGSCYIVMEYLPLGNSSSDSWYQWGRT